MQTEKKRILIIDDSPNDIQVLMQNLKQEYAVLVATDGTKGIEMAGATPKPDLILLDAMMPGMNGYETCEKLKADSETSDIDVIFISAHDTLEEKLAGYDAGGSDYLTKPVQADELMKKVSLSIKNTDIRHASSEEKNMAFQTAMTAMTNAGEQGIVLQFFQQCFATNNADDLACALVDFVSQFDLENTVQVRSSEGTYNQGTKLPVPPIESELLGRLKDSEKILSHGKRLIFNFDNISLLVKNVSQDAEKTGRLRDHIAVMLEGAQARLSALEKELEQKRLKSAIMDRVLIQMEEFFLTFGLTDDQEKKIIQVIEDAISKTLQA